MNFPRIAAAAVVAWIVSLGVGFLVNNVLLVGIYAPNAAAMRPQAEMMASLPLGFVFLLIGFFAFAYAYARGYEGGNGVMEGLRFGVVVALMVSAFGMIWMYVMFPIDGTMATAMIVDTIVEFAIYGALVGTIYRPAEVSAKQVATA